MTSRDEILRRVRLGMQDDETPPPAFAEGIVFEDPVSQFTEVLQTVGGRCTQAASAEQAGHILNELAAGFNARTVCSLISGVGTSTIDLSGISDPHLVQDVDLSIAPGELAVSENAAIWVTASTPVLRALLFLSQHLVLVVPRDAVVSNLHEAYARLDVAAAPFGCWISGPSKTADIEQSLVIGAHGPRSLTVILLAKE